jgi:hypothetical protein
MMIITRQSSMRPLTRFAYSLLAISVLLSKGLHLLQHASSIPRVHFAIYFPTFFILETLLCVSAWLLLFQCTGVKSVLGTVVTVGIT